jgi:hypothetical protein
MRLRWHTRVIELMSVYVNIFNFILSTNGSAQFSTLRDRPFNLKEGGGGGGGGGRVWFFVSFRNFFSDNTRVRINCFFHNTTLGYMAKTLNQIIFFFLHQSQNIFFSNIGNQNYFFRKNPWPPLQVKWSFPYINWSCKSRNTSLWPVHVLSWIILISAIVFA